MSARARARQVLPLLAGLFLAVVLVGGLALSRLGLGQVSTWLQASVDWARSAGPMGWGLFVLGQMLVAMVGVLPASLLGIASGAVYGIFGGFVLAAVGTMLGGWLAFLLARSLFRPFVERLLARRSPESRLARLDAEVARDGWRFVCLLRISPVMPFAVTSYALGLTEIAPRNYLLGTLASLPALLGYVAVGALARYSVVTADSGAPSGPFGWVLIAVGVVATLALILRSGALLARCGLLPGSAARS